MEEQKDDAQKPERDSETDKTGRDAKGRFAAGHQLAVGRRSPGRRPSNYECARRAFEKLGLDLGEQIGAAWAVTVRLAQSGDQTAMRLVAEKLPLPEAQVQQITHRMGEPDFSIVPAANDLDAMLREMEATDNALNLPLPKLAIEIGKPKKTLEDFLT